MKTTVIFLLFFVFFVFLFCFLSFFFSLRPVSFFLSSFFFEACSIIVSLERPCLSPSRRARASSSFRNKGNPSLCCSHLQLEASHSEAGRGHGALAVGAHQKISQRGERGLQQHLAQGGQRDVVAPSGTRASAAGPRPPCPPRPGLRPGSGGRRRPPQHGIFFLLLCSSSRLRHGLSLSPWATKVALSGQGCRCFAVSS